MYKKAKDNLNVRYNLNKLQDNYAMPLFKTSKQNCSSNQMYVEIKNKLHKAAYEALGVKHTSSGRKTEKWRNE